MRPHQPHNTNEPDTDSEEIVFNRIYRRHVNELTRYACKFVPREEAADIVHDVYITMWRQKKIFIPADEVRYFLYRCVLNACKNRLKHLIRTHGFQNEDAAQLQLAEIDFLEENIEQSADENMLNKVYRNIEKLPPKCREIFKEAYLYQKKSREIAEELHISRRTVEAQLYKAFKLLRRELLVFLLLSSLPILVPEPVRATGTTRTEPDGRMKSRSIARRTATCLRTTKKRSGSPDPNLFFSYSLSWKVTGPAFAPPRTFLHRVTRDRTSAVSNATSGAGGGSPSP